MKLLLGSAILAVAMAVAGMVCGVVGVYREFSAPWQAAAVAAGVCWLSGVGGLVVGAWALRRSPGYGVLAGMAIRMVGPLGCGVVLHRSGGELASSRVFGMMVACYLVMLVIETLVSLRSFTASKPSAASVESLPGV